MVVLLHSPASLVRLTCARPACHVPKLPRRVPAISSSNLLEEAAMAAAANDAQKLRSDFMQLLRSRRSEEVWWDLWLISSTLFDFTVHLSVELASSVKDPLHQGGPISREAMESCPRERIAGLEDMLQEENLYLMTDAYASRGYVAVAIDSRYHGKRAQNKSTYWDVWDLIKLADYLTQREDIDPAKIGITGESLGGMHAWFAAAMDTRYAVVVPIIGVQVWDRIAPGLASDFDSPYTVPVIAPRPLLILNGAEDPRCPLPGLEVPVSRALEAYKESNCPENFKKNAVESKVCLDAYICYVGSVVVPMNW
ncbi:hypothetical protein ACLOJK_020278 [Asimina triloba]